MTRLLDGRFNIMVIGAGRESLRYCNPGNPPNDTTHHHFIAVLNGCASTLKRCVSKIVSSGIHWMLAEDKLYLLRMHDHSLAALVTGTTRYGAETM